MSNIVNMDGTAVAEPTPTPHLFNVTYMSADDKAVTQAVYGVPSYGPFLIIKNPEDEDHDAPVFLLPMGNLIVCMRADVKTEAPTED